MKIKSIFGQYFRGEKGQALPLVLCVLAVGGLTVAGNLNYSTTSINGGRIEAEKTKGTYAAEAGVDDVLWSIVHSQVPPTQLGSNVNGMTVDISTLDMGFYMLYLGSLEPSVHTEWVDVSSSVVPSGVNTANYTITITRNPEQNPKQMSLLEVGAVLPLGYHYVPDSADVPGNLSLLNPSSNGTTPIGTEYVRWLWNSGNKPRITANHTQQFVITGQGSTSLTYSWINVQSQDISMVGEISGNRYQITATAKRPQNGKVTSRVMADVIIDGQATFILSWKVSN
jgi:hypothetical protein